MRWRIALLAAAVAACGGSTIRPLDPKDLSLPTETRQWVADATDGVAAARARRDRAAQRLEETDKWRDRTLREVKLGKIGKVSLSKAMKVFMGARVKLARLALKHEEAALDLAIAKYYMINAERAVLHDLARYSLEPLRQRTQAAEGRIKKTREKLWAQRAEVERMTTAWWKAYAAYLSAGGDTLSFWIGRAKPIKIKAAPKRKKKKKRKKG